MIRLFYISDMYVNDILVYMRYCMPHFHGDDFPSNKSPLKSIQISQASYLHFTTKSIPLAEVICSNI